MSYIRDFTVIVLANLRCPVIICIQHCWLVLLSHNCLSKPHCVNVTIILLLMSMRRVVADKPHSQVSFMIMMTSSNGNIFRVTGLLCGEFTSHLWIPAQRPVTRSFDAFFDLCLNKQLSKQWRRRWFETPSRSLWRHCSDTGINTGRRRPCWRHYLSGHKKPCQGCSLLILTLWSWKIEMDMFLFYTAWYLSTRYALRTSMYFDIRIIFKVKLPHVFILLHYKP